MELTTDDKAQIEEIRQDVGAFFSQLAAMFSAEYPARRAELAAAVASGDVLQVRQIAHRLCNSCGAVGALRLAQSFHDIEIRAAGGDCANLGGFLQEADDMYAAIQTWFACIGVT